MDSNRSRRDMGRYSQQGRGSCSFEKMDQYPLAMAYVPWQKFGSTYELEKGFHKGTIFPELDLPFMRARCSKS